MAEAIPPCWRKCNKCPWYCPLNKQVKCIYFNILDAVTLLFLTLIVALAYCLHKLHKILQSKAGIILFVL